MRNGNCRIARMSVAVSVVVPTCGRPDLLRRCVAALEQGLERAEFVTANCFVRRSVLERLGGFDETFRMPWREDADLQFRLLEAGCTIAAAPAALIVHPVRPAPWGVSLRQQRKVMFD